MSRYRTVEQQEQPIPRRASYTQDVPVTQQLITQPPVQQVRQTHWGTPLGCGAVIVLSGILIWTYMVLPTYQHLVDHWTYGASLVSEADTTINGQAERFIAFDDKGRITLIEIPDNHPEKSRIYQAAQMVGDTTNNRIVTVAFRDMNHDGKIDLIVSVEGESGYIVLFQTANGFTWQQ